MSVYYQTIVKPTPQEVAEVATEWLIDTIRECLAEKDRCSIALSGGSTPKQMYQLIANNHLDSLDWTRVVLFWGDERNVPHDHDESNYRMVCEAWLNHWEPTKRPIYHPVPVQVAAPERAAADYERTVLQVLGQTSSPAAGEDDTSPFPSLDIVLLGLGDDAHTASLFPETEALKNTSQVFVANYVPRFSAYRLTLTAPMINRARNIAFLVCGQSKRPAIQLVMHGPRLPDLYPAQMIEPAHGKLWWFLDAAAFVDS